METKMDALVLHAPKEYSIDRVPVPKPKDDEVLVKIKAVAICGSDPKLFAGDYRSINWPPKYPFIPGHEFSGEVIDMGKNVTMLKIGDRVAGEAHCGCGVCDFCKRGLYNLCKNYGNIEAGHRHYGFLVDGAYSQYAVYNEKVLSVMPSCISFEEGAMVDTAGTALQAVRLSGIIPGGWSLIIGPGPIGIIVMQIAKSMGSKTIVVGRRLRLQKAKQMGADYIVDYEKTDNIDANVLSIAGSNGVDRAFECAGSERAMNQCIKSLKKNGHMSIVSLPAIDKHCIAVKTMVMKQLHIHGSRANPNCSEDVLAMMDQGIIKVKNMVTHKYQLKDIKQAVETFVGRKDGALKVVLEPNV